MLPTNLTCTAESQHLKHHLLPSSYSYLQVHPHPPLCWCNTLWLLPISYTTILINTHLSLDFLFVSSNLQSRKFISPSCKTIIYPLLIIRIFIFPLSNYVRNIGPCTIPTAKLLFLTPDDLCKGVWRFQRVSTKKYPKSISRLLKFDIYVHFKELR